MNLEGTPIATSTQHYQASTCNMSVWWSVSEVNVSSVVSSLHTCAHVHRLPGSTITRRSHCNADGVGLFPSDILPCFCPPLRSLIRTQSSTRAPCFPGSTLAPVDLFSTIELAADVHPRLCQVGRKIACV